MRAGSSLKFGIVGLGYFGKHYPRLLKEFEGVTLVAVASRTRDAFERLGELLPSAVERHTDARKVFMHPEVDCVIIATPPSLHFGMAKTALGAGKHVLIEKPMTTSLKEARALEAAVAKSGRVFMVGHQYLYNDYIRTLKEKLNAGLIGPVRYLFAEHTYLGPIRADIGCFWETATHELAIIDYLFSPGKLAAVEGQSGGVADREDYAVASLKFESGLEAVIFVSWFLPEKVRRMMFAGSGGSALFDDRALDQKLKFVIRPYPESVPAGAYSQFLDAKDTEVLTPAVAASEPLKNQLAHFIESVRTGSAPLTDIAHGLRVTELLDTVSQRIAA